jgi:hypothetical protein
MHRRIAIACLATGGCWVPHVAGVVDGAGGTAGGSGSDATGTTAAIATSDGTASDTATDCDVPLPDPTCDAFADPLRTFELACYADVAAAMFITADTASWRRAHEFGNAYFAPRFGEALMVMTTGVLAEPDPSGQVAQDVGVAEPGVANDNPDDVDLPAPMRPTSGSNGGAGGAPFFDCDGLGDCSESLPQPWSQGGRARDLLWWSADVTVPAGARHLALDVAWLTAEFPERVGATANDTFVLWVSSEAFTGNVATLGGQPMTTTGLASLLAEHTGDDPMLLRTGVDGGTGTPCTVQGAMTPSCPRGAASDWLVLTAAVQPGETATIAGALFDQGDDLLDSMVLLDHFRWGCEACTPGTDCGLARP